MGAASEAHPSPIQPKLLPRLRSKLSSALKYGNNFPMSLHWTKATDAQAPCNNFCTTWSQTVALATNVGYCCNNAFSKLPILGLQIHTSHLLSHQSEYFVIALALSRLSQELRLLLPQWVAASSSLLLLIVAPSPIVHRPKHLNSHKTLMQSTHCPQRPTCQVSSLFTPALNFAWKQKFALNSAWSAAALSWSKTSCCPRTNRFQVSIRFTVFFTLFCFPFIFYSYARLVLRRLPLLAHASTEVLRPQPKSTTSSTSAPSYCLTAASSLCDLGQASCPWPRTLSPQRPDAPLAILPCPPTTGRDFILTLTKKLIFNCIDVNFHSPTHMP